MKITSAKAKGKLFENWFADFISDVFPNAQRQIGSGSGLKKGDISNTGDWTFELKNTKRLNLKKDLKQAEDQSLGYQKWGLVWHLQNQPMEKSFITLAVQDFKELLKAEKNQKPEGKIPEWLLRKARQVLKDVEKYL